MKAGSSGYYPEPDFALADRFKGAMSQLAGSVCVIAAGSGAERRGLTATAVCSVSVAPPTMLICVNRLGEAHRAIAKAGCFSVNVLGDGDHAIADRFAGRAGIAGVERFVEEEWGTLATGSPILLSSLVSVDCEVVEAVDAHTHTVFFGEVKEVRAGDSKGPLVHFDRRYRDLK